MIAQETIDKVREQMQILDIVSEFTTLKKAGVNYTAKCPMPNHDERTGSFVVSPVKNIFKCFGCGVGGTPLKFLQQVESYSYPDAIKYIAKLYKIEVVETITAEEAADRHVRENIYIINEYAAKKYHENLLQDPTALAYVKDERKMSDEQIEEFQIGYAPADHHWILNQALADHYTLEQLIAAGLVNPNEGKASGPYDKFTQRIMFPIPGITGRITGFTARTLKKDKNIPKYVNTAENEVFQKGKLLYGLNLAKHFITKEKICNLVEGQADVITMHGAGIKNTVASSGTALTIDQLLVIKRFADLIYILYDGDPAGRKAIAKGIQLAVANGMRVRVVLFPEGQDPDSYIRNFGVQAFNEYVDSNKMLMTRFFLFEANKMDGATKDQNTAFTLSVIAQISENEPFRREEYLKDVAEILKADIAMIRHMFRRYLGQSASGTGVDGLAEPEEDQPQEPFDQYEREYARILIRFGDKIHYSDTGIYELLLSECPPAEMFQSKLVLKIIDTYMEFLSNQVLPSIDDFINHADPEISEFATDLAFDMIAISKNWHGLEYIKPTAYVKEAQSGLNYLWLSKYTEAIKINQEALKDCTDQELRNKLLLKDKSLKAQQRYHAKKLGISTLPV